jgi:hypothetical protein
MPDDGTRKRKPARRVITPPATSTTAEPSPASAIPGARAPGRHPFRNALRGGHLVLDRHGRDHGYCE